MVDVVRHDVVIVGGGGAGLRAAIAACEADPKVSVALVSKVYPMRSHTVSAEGGAAAVPPGAKDDTLEKHAYDTVKGSDFLGDQDVIQYFVQEAPKELTLLEHWGCPWSRNPDGSVATRPFGGMQTPRTWYATDKVGFHMLHTLFQTSMKYERIVRYDEHFVTKLLVDGGACRGVASLDVRTGKMHAVLGRAVILTTGGAGKVWPFTTNGNIKTGDGMALAYREGVALKDMEFVQYHPTGLPGNGHPDYGGRARRGRLPAQLRGRALPHHARLRRRHQGRARPARHDLSRDHPGDRGGPGHRGARQARSLHAPRPAPPGRREARGAAAVRARAHAHLRGRGPGARAHPDPAGAPLHDGRRRHEHRRRHHDCGPLRRGRDGVRVLERREPARLQLADRVPRVRRARRRVRRAGGERELGRQRGRAAPAGGGRRRTRRGAARAQARRRDSRGHPPRHEPRDGGWARGLPRAGQHAEGRARRGGSSSGASRT